MKLLYWLAWVLAALAFWLAIGWFGLAAVTVDPYFDRQKAAVVYPSKESVAGIESQHRTAFMALGVGGGVLCGFAFGVAGWRFSRTRPAGRQPEARR